MNDDLDFARRTEEAWERFENGDFTTTSKEDISEEMDKW